MFILIFVCYLFYIMTKTKHSHHNPEHFRITGKARSMTFIYLIFRIQECHNKFIFLNLLYCTVLSRKAKSSVLHITTVRIPTILTLIIFLVYIPSKASQQSLIIQAYVSKLSQKLRIEFLWLVFSIPSFD